MVQFLLLVAEQPINQTLIIFFCQNREKEERERRIKEIEEMRKRVRKEKSLQSWQYQWKLEILTLLEYNYISSK